MITRRKKPQRGYSETDSDVTSIDLCATPRFAVDLIIPYLPEGVVIWESAAGEKRHMAVRLREQGFKVIDTDIAEGYDYFVHSPGEWDIQVTNPPYHPRKVNLWIERAFELGKPWALLLKTEVIGFSRPRPYLELAEKYTCRLNGSVYRSDIQIIFPRGRISYIMPHAGYKDNGAQFHTSWFTWGLNLPKQIMLVDLPGPGEKLI